MALSLVDFWAASLRAGKKEKKHVELWEWFGDWAGWVASRGAQFGELRRGRAKRGRRIKETCGKGGEGVLERAG